MGKQNQSEESTKALYSPSTNRVIAPVCRGMMGTYQLDENGQADKLIYAAPVFSEDMKTSWTNAEITDWQERDIDMFTDPKRGVYLVLSG